MSPKPVALNQTSPEIEQCMPPTHGAHMSSLTSFRHALLLPPNPAISRSLCRHAMIGNTFSAFRACAMTRSAQLAQFVATQYQHDGRRFLRAPNRHQTRAAQRHGRYAKKCRTPARFITIAPLVITLHLRLYPNTNQRPAHGRTALFLSRRR